MAGKEEQYLRHFFGDFAYNPAVFPEEEVQRYVMQIRQLGNLRASLNHYGYIPRWPPKPHEPCKDQACRSPCLLQPGEASVWVITASIAPRPLRCRRGRRDRRMRALVFEESPNSSTSSCARLG